jgi:hypothetical protein
MNIEQITTEALANELQHEIDRLTTLCRGQHAELYSARIELKTLKALITATHKAKGRYHSQIAMCDLYDALDLPNVRPISKEKS